MTVAASRPEKLLTVAEAAEILGCSVRTLRRRVEDKHLPVIRNGRLIRIDPEDLKRFIRVRRG